MALASGEITGLGCYHGFWNMELRASHVLAQGAGTSDVVRDMWKLSRVYPAQPSLGLLRGETAGFTAVRHRKPVFRQTNLGMLCVCMNVCAFFLDFRFGCVGVYVCHCTLVWKKLNP